MGTRSLTFVHDERDGAAPIVCVYQQYDGYFDGVGEDILSFLKGSEVVNGIGVADHTVFNGSGDLAARLITHFKRGDADNAGGVYVESPTLADGDMGTEFAYHIYCTVGQPPYLVAKDLYGERTVEGPVSEFAWTAFDPNDPMTDDQRRALFAAYGKVFGGDNRDGRLAFTRIVLAAGPTDTVSWSKNAPGSLTAGEASRVLDALVQLEAAL